MNADKDEFHHGGNVLLLEPLELFEPLEQKLFTTKDTKDAKITSRRLNCLNGLNRLNKSFSP